MFDIDKIWFTACFFIGSILILSGQLIGIGIFLMGAFLRLEKKC